MGKPAARIGDMTSHGGSIVAGAPNVLIGGKPAARVGDQHVCPMLNPGSPGPPHVGGPIGIGSPTVFIGGMMAARLGDMAVCQGPPDSIAAGCPTVLIGEAAGGGSPGGGSGAAAVAGGSSSGAAASGAGTSAAIAQLKPTGSDQDDDLDQAHWLDVRFLDRSGLPIAGVGYNLTGMSARDESGRLSGPIRRSGIDEGSCSIDLRCISSVSWSVEEAEVGDEVELIVETVGMEDGAKAELAVYIRDASYSDRLLDRLDAKVSGDQVRTSWTLEVDDEFLDMCRRKEKSRRYSQPFFFYTVTVEGMTGQSDLLCIRDYIEIELYDESGNPGADERFRVVLSSGEIREGTLDGNGFARVENVPPGVHRIEFPDRDDI